jgi:hypothetical protein
MVFVLVMSFTSTAFATGNGLVHSGYSYYGYTTNDYVRQQYDNHLKCHYVDTDHNGMVAQPVDDSGVAVSGEYAFTIHTWFIPEHPQSPRSIHVKLTNTGACYGVRTWTSGGWHIES